MKHIRYHQFVVTGKVAFPLDMLRYDACFPATGEDAAKIEASINRERDENGKVKQHAITLSTASEYSPTPGRWSSFMWKVVTGE